MSASKTGSSTIFTAACTIRSRTGGIDKRPLLIPRTRLGNKHPARRQRPIAAFLQLGGQLAEEPVYAVLLELRPG